MNGAPVMIAMRRSAVLGLGMIVFRLLAIAWAAEATETNAAGRQPMASSGLSDVNIQAIEQLQASHWGRDPFVQPTSREASAGDLALTSILYSPASSVAVINGQVVRSGDDVDGRRVVSIGPDYVIVREGMFTRRLEVPKFSLENGKGIP
ncbi:MAG TPA: hypothetical protein VEI24_02815 [Nitrospiria bacterium]|nr:hypothetical protein [Nitrospiria bacterium]